ncbi:gamma-glutamyltranspeptidase [Pseudoalteromonas tunicata]|uniref:Glutathione hydrolase proenzyme n=2 Tax=Pseudoalteromonas tunicata TaxID=314281 RepID=A4C9K5_9GAMM|nr:gamma-glutamyltransferase [Pseudoalteromonas tunicata]ATC94610.1 gamma-glutamyltranspeptidase [Pseudoalteromonas tunicata]AXT30332.1 gamma-glutamyltransferase [Pseudoalteromonas tunicata]EAR28063.1 putative gamma-glutamyltranspeptidase [Pseudoalteromonas tunicata D2]
MYKLSSYLLCALLPLSVLSQTPVREDREPEAKTGFEIKKTVIGQKYMVAAANPYAVKAGQAMLEQGGSAVDAAIAVQLVLTLVEPQSSGIGGGAFILHYDQQKNTLITYDGRETAPATATPELFLDNNGKAVPWIKAVVGGRSVGVPGVLAALAKAHAKDGKLPWASLFKPAIELAEQGFVVSPRLALLLKKQFNPGVHQLAVTKDYFFPNGEALKAGTIKKNPELAAFYRTLAKEGISAFYQGDNAKKLAETVQNSAVAPGLLTEQDVNNYQAKLREPVCAPYHQYKVCSMGPPSSGGIAVLEMLSLLEQKNLKQYQPNDVMALHYFTQASRLAFADRDVYLGDPDFVSLDVMRLLDKEYINTRAKLITDKDMGEASVGEPNIKLAFAKDDAYEMPSTSHMSIIDAKGNAISMTTSIEMAFGSALMTNGYLLNNQLTDFALSPHKNGKPLINRVEGNKRPRSSMSPMMVFNADGSLRLIVGSPGGSRIINYVAQTIIGVLDWQLSLQQAIDLPKITNRNKITSLEKDTALVDAKTTFEQLGHTVQMVDLNSGLHGIEVINGKYYGGADPRREGIVLSDLTTH